MKLLFTADLHIKLGQKNVPQDWARNRYNLLWQQLAEKQASADVFVIGVMFLINCLVWKN